MTDKPTLTIETTTYLKSNAVKWAVDAGASPKELVTVAKDIYTFLTEHQEQPKAIQSESVRQPTPVKTRHWSPKTLTNGEVPVHKEILRLHKAGEKISGSKIADILKMSQANTSYHIRNLIAKGYVWRKPNTNQYTPKLTVGGEPLPLEIVKYPDGKAEGYKQPTIGDVVLSKGSL